MTKKSYQELEAENQLFRFALDKIHEGMYIIDQDRVIIEYNKVVEDTEGMSREDAIGKTEQEVYGNIPDFDFIQKFTEPVFKSKKPIINNYYEYRVRGGKKTAILMNVYPYIVKGEVKNVITIGRNINQVKDFIIQTLSMRNKLEVIHGKNPNGAKYFLDDIIGESAPMKRLITQAKKVARRDSPILIYGETGTGKELLANGIHNNSMFLDGPFVSVNCAAIPETLLESILFGVAKGSFTGAVENPGLFEQAEGGSLFLDEINSMPLNLQAKLLRVIQEKSVRRIGGAKEIPVNCRIISATNKSTKETISLGTMREDLFYRLSTVELKIPPLRDRKEDIQYLVGYFIQKYNVRFGLFVEGISPELQEMLRQYDWPGNIRELENMIESSMNLIETKERILTPRHLSDYFLEKFADLEPVKECRYPHMMRERLQQYEKKLLAESLVHNNYNVVKVAAEFGVTRQNIYHRLKKLGISVHTQKTIK